MASSGSFSGSIHGGHYVLRVDWSQAKDITNNRSTITAKMVLANDYTLYISGRTDNTCTIDGQSGVYSSPAVETTGSHTLGTVSKVVSHNSDGSKSITISAVFYIRATISGTYYDKITASASITLDSIPRTSSVSASSVDLGTATTITISRASSSFTHTLTYAFSGTSGTIASKTTATQLSWIPPLSLASTIPNAESALCTITCTTYLRNTWIGSKSTSIRLSVPASILPSIGSLSANRVEGDVPTIWEGYIQSKTRATLQIQNAAGSYGSTIRAYQIEGDGFFANAQTLTTGYLSHSGTVTFTATVTDSRGRTSKTASVSINITPYFKPFFTSSETHRTDAAGVAKNDGTYLTALNSFYFASCDGLNQVTTATYYKKLSDATWTNASASFSKGVDFTYGGGQISTEDSYEVKYVVTDFFTSVSFVESVSTAAVVMDFKQGGNALAIGKVSEYDTTFEVAPDWDVRVYGMLLSSYIASQPGIPFGTCESTADAVYKTATLPGFVLRMGCSILIKFTNTNTASLPRLNVNGTGDIYMVNVGKTAVGSYYWRPDQTVLFVYDGVYWVAMNMPLATTEYYGITKLSSSISSTSTTLAATASAVKQAYDRNSWASISLTSPLAVSYGGTGATNATAARRNLGISATSLYNGVITTGSTTFSKNYKFFIIIGQPSSYSSRCDLVIPSSQLTTSAVNYQIADESNFYSFKLYYSGSTVTLAYADRSSSGQVLRVFGVN